MGLAKAQSMGEDVASGCVMCVCYPGSVVCYLSPCMC